ncbi:MAG: SDR family oxidoreductase [Oscillospiraceae bacterium]|nr:SDR family oxidoreductase [Oscillospiraceae bacterium]
MKKVAFISGGSRGIGAAAAKLFCQNGYFSVIGYNQSQSAAQALVQQLQQQGLQAAAVQCDVRDEQQVQSAIAFAEAQGELAVVVNSAGVSHFAQIQDESAAEMDEVFAVNTRGTMLVCREAARGMVARHAGSMINISSMWGVVGASCEAVYSASKAAIIGFTKALAKELAASGITVNCIAPGVIDTDMNRQLGEQLLVELAADTPLGRIGKAEEVAQAALYFAKAPFVTGQVLSVDGGFSL